MDGQTLKMRMKLAGVTMKQIERETGVKYSSINQYLNGYQGVAQRKKELIEKFIENMECMVEDQSNIDEPPELKIRSMCLKMKALATGMLNILENGFVTENIPNQKQKYQLSPEEETMLDKIHREGREEDELEAF